MLSTQWLWRDILLSQRTSVHPGHKTCGLLFEDRTVLLAQGTTVNTIICKFLFHHLEVSADSGISKARSLYTSRVNKYAALGTMDDFGPG